MVRREVRCWVINEAIRTSLSSIQAYDIISFLAALTTLAPVGAAEGSPAVEAAVQNARQNTLYCFMFFRASSGRRALGLAGVRTQV